MTAQFADLNHWIGGDVSASPVGDLATVTGTLRGQQRILRRLKTNPGDYLFQPEYGAGLGQYVGSTATVGEIEGVIQEQLALEACVAPDPAPVVSIVLSNTTLSITIQYTDATTLTAQTLSFDEGTMPNGT